jgi:hypothetical protein
MALTLATVETAIIKLLEGGQSVSVDGMSFSQSSMDSLIKLRDKMKHEADRSTRPTIRAVDFNGMGY